MFPEANEFTYVFFKTLYKLGLTHPGMFGLLWNVYPSADFVERNNLESGRVWKLYYDHSHKWLEELSR